MTRRVNRKELCEAIRQSQVRMKERMEGPEGLETNPRPEPVRFQLRQPTPKREKRPRKPLIPPAIPATIRQIRIQPKYLAFAVVGLVFVAGVVWLGKAMNRQETAMPTAGLETENTQTVSMRPPAQPTTPVRPENTTRPPVERAPLRQPTQAAAATQTPPAANPNADHVVVIATYVQRRPLEPVAEHFNANGIATEIIQRGSYYLVVTKERFESSQRTESTGKRLLEQISEIGARYKAPQGYAGFAKATFDSAYFRKL